MFDNFPSTSRTTHRARATLPPYFVVKNQGNAKATGVQIFVRPYRGASSMAGEDRRMNTVSPYKLPENDPLSQLGQWVELTDLGPGETCSESGFVSQGHFSPGVNPDPQIIFETEKVNPLNLLKPRLNSEAR